MNYVRTYSIVQPYVRMYVRTYADYQIVQPGHPICRQGVHLQSYVRTYVIGGAPHPSLGN